MTDFAIRRLRPGDSPDALTQMLHRAFDDLARQGIACQCAHQDVATTRGRIARGDCFVAVTGGTIIGTLTLEQPDRASAIACYRDPATASVHQLAVDPGRQGEGVGRSLLAHACSWARARRFARLALDTPEGALRQVAWYVGRGFDVVDHAQVPGRGYRSVVLAMSLDGSAARRSRYPTSTSSLMPSRVQPWAA